MKRVAIANLKGGVGKSTTTLFLAEHWALAGRRILVLDLDPQSNVSLMLLSRRWLNAPGNEQRTMPRLIADELAATRRDAMSYVVSRAGDLQELQAPSAGQVAIIPSIPRLAIDEFDLDRQYWQNGLDPVASRVELLNALFRDVEKLFDCVIIDCQPGFGPMIRAATSVADLIVSPTIADQVSVRSLGDFVTLGLGERLGIPSGKHFIVVSKFTGTNEQRNELDLLRRQYGKWVLAPAIPFRDHVARITTNIQGRLRGYDEKYRRPLIRPLAPHIDAMAKALASIVF